MRYRGHGPGFLAGDLAYSSSRPEDYQLPARALGYDLVSSHKIDQLGQKAESNGFIQVEGRWYCPSMPDALINASIDYRAGKIDDDTYAKRIKARRAYEARPKANPDADGYQRLLCPAARGAPTATCSLKSETPIPVGATPVRITPRKELTERPPTCCRQESVTVPPTAGAKFGQALPFATEEHRQVYGPLGNAIEGTNGFRKDGGHQGMGDPLRRRIRGVAAQSVLVTMQIVAANWRRIDSFLQRIATGERSVRRTRPRRRATHSIKRWLPEDPNGHGGRAPPKSG